MVLWELNRGIREIFILGAVFWTLHLTNGDVRLLSGMYDVFLNVINNLQTYINVCSFDNLKNKPCLSFFHLVNHFMSIFFKYSLN